MPATGGKAYMLLLEDIIDLAESDEYRLVYTAKLLFHQSPTRHSDYTVSRQ